MTQREREGREGDSFGVEISDTRKPKTVEISRYFCSVSFSLCSGGRLAL